MDATSTKGMTAGREDKQERNPKESDEDRAEKPEKAEGGEPPRGDTDAPCRAARASGG